MKKFNDPANEKMIIKACRQMGKECENFKWSFYQKKELQALSFFFVDINKINWLSSHWNICKCQ